MKSSPILAILAVACAQGQQPAPAPAPVPTARPVIVRPDVWAQAAPSTWNFKFDRNASEDRLYEQGSRQLQRRDYQGAQALFSEIVKRGGTREEGASYWNAYALYKLGKSQEALSALGEMQKKHPTSRWINDAKALDLEIRQSQGQNVSPEQQSDEELKLMALAGLMQSESSRAIPVLKRLLSGSASVLVKEQALFVLAQSTSPEARQLLGEFARGAGNPDLQMVAVEMIGVRGGGDTGALLTEIYGSTQDVALKRRIISGLTLSKSGDRLYAIARSEPNLTLRSEAIHGLGVMRDASITGESAKKLYQAESERRVKSTILDVLAMRKDGKTLTEIFRSETDRQLKKEALERLQHADPKAAADLMISILEK